MTRSIYSRFNHDFISLKDENVCRLHMLYHKYLKIVNVAYNKTLIENEQRNQ